MELVIAQIADKNGVTVEEVRRDISETIAAAMSDPDPAVQNRWKQCPCAGDVPTPEEMIFWVSGMVSDGLSHKEL